MAATAIDKVQYLQIGVQGNNNADTLEFDMTAWAEQYPNATFHILFKPYNETEVSPQVPTYDTETKVLSWTVGAGATAVVGVGYTEIRAQDGQGLVKKTRVIPTAVENSVSGVEVNPPAAYADWVTNVLNVGSDAEAYATGKRNGADVPVTDETYHNNSKYYADRANEDSQVAYEQRKQAIDEWLDDHPEATTTVLDGSLTEAKFINELKLKTIKDYVTPEMFGAAGDGETDDTVALQSALSAGIPVNLNGKTYKITDTIYASGKEVQIYNGTIDVSAIASKEAIKFFGERVYKNDSYTIDKTTKIVPSTWGLGNEKYIMMAKNSVTSVGDYTTGIYVQLNGRVVEGVINADVTNATVEIYRPINVSIDNVEIKNVHPTSIGLTVSFASGSIRNCRMNSLGGRIGINAHGVGLVIEGCNVRGFTDVNLVDNRTGYGILISGQNNIIKDCIITDCKHCVCGSSTAYWSYNNKVVHCALVQNTKFLTDILSVATDWDHGYWAAVDFHALTDNAVVEDCTIICIGSQTAAKIWGTVTIFRPRSFICRNNVFWSDTEEIRQTTPSELDIDYVVFKGNKFVGKYYWNIGDLLTSNNIAQFYIVDNIIQGSTLELPSTVTGEVVVNGNRLFRIRFKGALSRLVIENNIIYNSLTNATIDLTDAAIANLIMRQNDIYQSSSAYYMIYANAAVSGIVINNYFPNATDNHHVSTSSTIKRLNNFNSSKTDINSN